MRMATWLQIGRRRPETRVADVFKGLAAGLVGGLVGTVVMTQFQTLANEASHWLGRSESGKDSESNGQRTDETQHEQSEPATAKAATAISTTVLRHQLKGRELQVAGSAVHYGFGTTMGGLYGAAAEVYPVAATCSGTLFGSVLWFAADEVAVPLLRLGSSPIQTSVSMHVYALASHLVYGFTTDVVRRAVRTVL